MQRSHKVKERMQRSDKVEERMQRSRREGENVTLRGSGELHVSNDHGG